MGVSDPHFFVVRKFGKWKSWKVGTFATRIKTPPAFREAQFFRNFFFGENGFVWRGHGFCNKFKMWYEIHNNFYSSCYICHCDVLCLVLGKKKCTKTINLGFIFVIMQLLKLHQNIMQQRYKSPWLPIPKPSWGNRIRPQYPEGCRRTVTRINPQNFEYILDSIKNNLIFYKRSTFPSTY